jgi:pimeloyl-ACP methyl ester carboxylesterase
LPPDAVWTVLTKKYEQVTLHPDDLRYEALQPARVQSDQIYEIAYRELIEELRHNLTPRADQPVPVFPFGYDWRRPLAETEERLAAFIDEVSNRTRLLRHYDADGYANDPRVNLVGHSMGGLIVAGCLERMAGAKTASKIGKIATLASPFRGSFEAVVKVTTGTADLGGDVPSSRERESARLTPALYHLYPSIADESAIVIDPGLPKSSLFDPALVQPSIVETIAEFIRLNGLDEKDPGLQAKRLVSEMLSTARQHRERIEKLSLQNAGKTPADWLCVVGVGCETRVRMKVANLNGMPMYDLRSSDRKNDWTDTIATDPSDPATEAARRQTGDGTVPFDGAVPGFLKVENLICVTPEDFGYWEVQDRLLSSQAGFHGILPNMNMLHRMIVAHFNVEPKRRTDKYGNIWGRPAPGVTRKAWSPAIQGLPATPDKG